MRLFLTTVILTILAQPVWAQQMNASTLYSHCLTWQKGGYGNNFENNLDGLKGATCAAYMAAMSDLGSQSCRWDDDQIIASWEATKEHLAAAFIIEIERRPEFLSYNPFSFISVFAPQMFPCD